MRGPERTAAGVLRQIPILARNVGRKVCWILRHSGNVKHVVGRMYSTACWYIPNLRCVSSLLVGAHWRHWRSFLPCSTRYSNSALSDPDGHNRAPRVLFPSVTLTRVIGDINSWSLPCVKRISRSGFAEISSMLGSPVLVHFQDTAYQ